MIKVEITKHIYLDNYENGMVDGTYHCEPIDSYEVGKNLPDAIVEAVTKAFHYAYADSDMAPEYKLEENGNLTIFISGSYVVLDAYDQYASVSSDDIEQWEKGKKDLYLIEYRIQFEQFTHKSITEEDLNDDVRSAIISNLTN